MNKSRSLGVLVSREPSGLLLCAAALLCVLMGAGVQAQQAPPEAGTEAFSLLPENLGPQMFFDAGSTSSTVDGKKQVFSGDVVAVGAGVLITADEIRMDRKKNMLEADGHVIILTEDQVFLGDRLSYGFNSGDFLIVNSSMIANDTDKSAEISRRVLGFTPAELAFESQKTSRLTVLEKRKSELRDQYIEQVAKGNEEPEQNLVDRYSLLLEQQDLMERQVNPFLARMSQERRRRYKARRFHWEKGLKDAKRMKQGRSRVTSFFRIDGKKITRANTNDYHAEDAFWTPCKCDDDEEPAWGFRATAVDAQPEGYVDFYHPVLEIKGVPVLYLPYMKVPIKEKRQSGLLMPTFGQRSSSGNIYSQPVFFALSDDLDTTLTTELHEKRGTKLGIEARYQQKRYSGWSLNLEGIRDRAWMDDIRRRREAQEYYFGNNQENILDLCEARGNVDVDAIAECIRSEKNKLDLPENNYRGALKWNGLNILAPRLSFVSSGTINSDHRYVEDLTVYDDFESALEGNSRATYFSTARHQTHLDAKNFYAGIGGRFGDNVNTTERYKGQQIPYTAVTQSRFYSLDRGYLPIPLYAQIKGEHVEIADFVGESDNLPQETGLNKRLGSGYWQSAKVDQVSPIITDSFFKMDQFAEFESRAIGHENLDESRSTIWSWRSGVTFNLPIDGDARLPAVFQDDENEGFGDRFMRHYMNWRMTFSLRPEVHRKGPYGEYESQHGAPLVYFASDRDQYIDKHNDIRKEETMVTHKLVSFSTEHTWDTFDRGWQKIGGGPTSDASDLTYRERARRELLLSADLPLGDTENLNDLTEEDWYVSRYKIAEKNKDRIITFDAEISYDFDEVPRREEERQRRAELPDNDENRAEKSKGQNGLAKPWSDPVANTSVELFDTKLSNLTRYDLYSKLVVEQNFTLKLPTFASTSITFGYSIRENPQYDEVSLTTKSVVEKESWVKFNTGIIPHFALKGWFGRRTKKSGVVEQQEKIEKAGKDDDYKSVFGVVYNSPTDCWQLAFQRQKRYGDDEREAEYLLQLSVIFLGLERPTPNISAGLVRELPGREEG